MRRPSAASLVSLACAFAVSTATMAHADKIALSQALLCQKTIAKQGRTYAKKREAALLKCIDKLLKCEILLEVDGINANTCRASATDSCTKTIGPAADSALSKAATAFETKAGTACLAYGIAKMLDTTPGAGGLWFANDSECGTSIDVPTLVDCVRERIEEQTDAIVGEVKPRASLLLDNAGLGGNFPDLPRPPTTTVVVSATAPGSGVLVSPGTIHVALGNALRMEGDPATLPCGGGMGQGQNGKLTITIGSGASAQERQLKENYVGDFALFGPFTTAGSIPYTIQLKDASCNDTVSGSVSIP